MLAIHSVRNRKHIFLMPVLSPKVFSYGSFIKQWFSPGAQFIGVLTGLIEILQQLLPKVKREGMCVAKHQLHVLSGCCSTASSLVLRAFTEAYRCVKFILSLDLLVLCHDKRTKSI